MATSQDFVNWVCDPEMLDYRFLKYVLLAERESFLRFAHGTTHQTIYFPEVKAFHICVPSFAEQRAIADVLSSLDDKIEANRRTSAALERLARVLFRAWFVDFEPVKAKAAGATSFPSIPQPLFDLLPTNLVDSPLGFVPHGWITGELQSLATVVMGASPPGDTYNEYGIGIPLVNGPVEFGSRFPLKHKWTTSPTRICGQHDLLFCVRGSTTGRRVRSDGQYCLGRGVCSIRSNADCQPFVDYLIGMELQRLLARTTGSVFPNLSASLITSFPVLVPPPEFMSGFSEIVGQFDLLGDIAEAESTKLTEMRDYLLPKLLSGEIRVVDAERVVAGP